MNDQTGKNYFKGCFPFIYHYGEKMSHCPFSCRLCDFPEEQFYSGSYTVTHGHMTNGTWFLMLKRKTALF